jgi:hypothetical protein
MGSGISRTSRWDLGTIDLRELARRRLPAVPSLGTNDAVIAWRERMIDACRAGRDMTRIGLALVRFGDIGAASECAVVARHERNLAVLAGGAVEALGGAAVFQAELLDEGLRIDAEEEVESHAEWLFRALASVALVAVAAATRLGVARACMPSGDLLGLVTHMHRAEVHRSRFAWSVAEPLAATLSCDALSRTEEHLANALSDLELRAMAQGGAVPTEDELALGVVKGTGVRRAFYKAVSRKVLPKLERAGVRADFAWAGRARLASTG